MDNLFVNTSSESYEKEIIEAYENITGRTLNPADPERLIIDVITYAVSVIACNIEYTGKQNLLAFATGERLDAIGDLYGVSRLQAKPALVTLRFYLDSPLDYDIVIPQGTTVSAGSVYFETLSEAKIPASQISVTVQAQCTQSGDIGNGFVPGQINTIVQPIPLVKVTNTTMSMYGCDIEDDDRYRERIRLSLERFSVAGPRKAYEYWARTAHQDITDVSVVSSEPGTVNVYILVNNDLPTQDIIDYVEEFLSDEKRRPLTDKVVVAAPSTTSYDINVTYYIHKDKSAMVDNIQTKVKKSVDDFVKFTDSKIGRDVIPSELVSKIVNAGAYRVDVTSPSYIEVDSSTVAKVENISVNYGGLVDD